MAHAGIGPVAVVRHVGRRTGKMYETPMLLVRVDGGFVAELTYGESADWYRNAVAGGCVVALGEVEYPIGKIRKYPYREGIRAFGLAGEIVLKLLGRREFRILLVERP
ncbi:nitroreductase family deazaflavin-dependent oxidoreductase [Actinoplanes sp. TBRC 11911]|nr:nitroreductase family deazaflavin-dependent oxidoreductase [Actinoplanes sp. TBRC 11911]